jgi:hypothetical protein
MVDDESRKEEGEEGAEQKGQRSGVPTTESGCESVLCFGMENGGMNRARPELKRRFCAKNDLPMIGRSSSLFHLLTREILPLEYSQPSLMLVSTSG